VAACVEGDPSRRPDHGLPRSVLDHER
jgi:hypothetical protein